MNWYINQEIVAVKNHSQNVFKEGDMFTIQALKLSPCKCKFILIDIGRTEPNTFIGRRCSCCGYEDKNYNDMSSYAEVNFAPLDSLTNIDELKEVLTEPAFN